MRLNLASAEDVFAVAENMRESDYTEFEAMCPASGRLALAKHLAGRFGGRPDVLMASFDGRRVAIGGLIEYRPNVLSLLFFATDDFNKHALDISKVVKRLLAGVKTVGVHRIEAVSIVGHHEAHRWIRWLGLEPEGPPMRGYGKRGEPHQQFAWAADTCPPAS